MNLEQAAAPKHAQELREMWQAKALAATRRDPLGMVVLSMLAHCYPDAIETLLRVVFPGFTGIAAPFLCTCGRIAKTGHITADIVTRGGAIEKNAAIFTSTQTMQGHFRDLADKLKLSDAERVEMFSVLRKWVVCDFRLDPTMNPQDPDAKRLVH